MPFHGLYFDGSSHTSPLATYLRRMTTHGKALPRRVREGAVFTTPESFEHIRHINNSTPSDTTRDITKRVNELSKKLIFTHAAILAGGNNPGRRPDEKTADELNDIADEAVKDLANICKKLYQHRHKSHNIKIKILLPPPRLTPGYHLYLSALHQKLLDNTTTKRYYSDSNRFQKLYRRNFTAASASHFYPGDSTHLSKDTYKEFNAWIGEIVFE